MQEAFVVRVGNVVCQKYYLIRAEWKWLKKHKYKKNWNYPLLQNRCYPTYIKDISKITDTYVLTIWARGDFVQSTHCTNKNDSIWLLCSIHHQQNSMPVLQIIKYRIELLRLHKRRSLYYFLILRLHMFAKHVIGSIFIKWCHLFWKPSLHLARITYRC